MDKKIKIGLLLTFLIFTFLSIKFVFFQKKPPSPSLPSPAEETLSPEETVIKYLHLEQGKNRQEAEKYLFSDFSKVEILGKSYYEIQNLSLGFYYEKTSTSSPEFEIITSEIKEDKAKVILQEIPNQFERTIFFEFLLPEKIIFETNLIKEGGQWKIVKINSPNLVLEKKLGEKIEISENLLVKPIEIKEYKPKNPNIRPEAGFKFFYFLSEYENQSTDTIVVSPPFGWTLIDENKNVYTSSRHLNAGREIQEVAVPPEIILEPEEIKSVYFFFQIPRESQPEKLIFKNLNKKVIFEVNSAL